MSEIKLRAYRPIGGLCAWLGSLPGGGGDGRVAADGPQVMAKSGLLRMTSAEPGQLSLDECLVVLGEAARLVGLVRGVRAVCGGREAAGPFG